MSKLTRTKCLLSLVILGCTNASWATDSCYINPRLDQVFVDDTGLVTVLGSRFPWGATVKKATVGGFALNDVTYDPRADSIEGTLPLTLATGDYQLLIVLSKRGCVKRLRWNLTIEVGSTPGLSGWSRQSITCPDRSPGTPAGEWYYCDRRCLPAGTKILGGGGDYAQVHSVPGVQPTGPVEWEMVSSAPIADDLWRTVWRANTQTTVNFAATTYALCASDPVSP